MATQRKPNALLAAVDAKKPATNGAAAPPEAGAEVDYEDYRKQFEPVAPWKRDNIPDYGPIKDEVHLGIFVAIGVLATIFYEYTDYFDQVGRLFAYVAIWFPLWFRLLTRVSPQLTDEEIEAKEKREFQKELERIQKEAEELDE